MNTSLAEKLKNLPLTPGVYLFRDVNKKIIYVGKAKNLKNRVGSYFHVPAGQETKTGALVARINDLEVLEVESELDALILEADLIKKYKPKYNIIQKDDKTYIYIVIKDEPVIINREKIIIPKIVTARKTELNPKDTNFGPFPDGSTVRFIVRSLRKLFPYRDCSISKFRTYHRRGKPCLYGQLHLCPAPCVNFDGASIADYKKNIKNVKKILQGKGSRVLRELENLMNRYSASQEYEKAAHVRDIVTKYRYVRQKPTSPERYIENPMLIEDRAQEVLTSLMQILSHVKTKISRIECYDISNISGKEAVGSMVVSTDGKVNKSEYKRFKIKTKHTPDDFEMMREVLTRRLNHFPSDNSRNKNWPVPHLLVIDGGAGQVSAVEEVLAQKRLVIPVIGLAKKEETIVFKDRTGGFHEIHLDVRNPGLKHLIALRDEAHRFAQQYHHKLRIKTLHI